LVILVARCKVRGVRKGGDKKKAMKRANKMDEFCLLLI